MPVVVRPDTFSMVRFEAAEVQGIVEKLVADIGLPDDLPVTIEIDETTPMGRAEVASVDPIVISAESGALEDAKAPRRLSAAGTADVLGKLLFSVRDRLDPDFGDPPAEDDLTLQESVAWEVHCVARLGRLGHPVQRQRRLYQFRTRHGFNDASDAAFDALWDGDGLTWADIERLSTSATAGAAA